MLVLASSRFTRGLCLCLCLCLRRTYKPALKPWQNGTPNPTRAKLQNQNLHGWVAKRTTKSSQLARNHSIVWIRPRCHKTITKQLGESWLELAEAAKRWKTSLELGENFELDPIQANSIQLKPSGWPNATQLHRNCELSSSWQDQNCLTRA